MGGKGSGRRGSDGAANDEAIERLRNSEQRLNEIAEQSPRDTKMAKALARTARKRAAATKKANKKSKGK